jgi:ferredoxin
MERPLVDESTCIGSGNCEAVCPADPVVFKVEDKSKVIHPEACIQ